LPFGGSVGKELSLITGTLVIDTTANGGATKNDMPTTLFGVSSIVACLGIINSTNANIYPGVPADDNLSFMVGGGASGAAADLPNATYYVALIVLDHTP
jgi:hypothetical protein